jgi:hypothetical protein
MALFLKIGIASDPKIAGASKDKDHPGWLDILSRVRPGDRKISGLRRSNYPRDDLYFLKEVRDDRELSDLFNAFTSGLHFDTALLHEVETGKYSYKYSYWWEFRDVELTGFLQGQRAEPSLLILSYQGGAYHTGSPILGAGGGAASLGALSEADTAAAGHMLRQHQISSEKKK